jgi:hypothetical protein
VTGNLAKVGLSLLSIGFDVIFMSQHYLCYRGSKIKTEKSENENLLPSEENLTVQKEVTM